MLRQLSIHHLAVVEQLELQFDSGMTTLTGETGAGKSILIDALGLTLGERAESTLVRPGFNTAEVSALFEIDRLPEVIQWLQQQELLEEQDKGQEHGQGYGQEQESVQGQEVTQAKLFEKALQNPLQLQKKNQKLQKKPPAKIECILRRTISNDGRSRAYINGRAVPVAQLKELGEYLVNIHGQHQHQSLLKPDHQRLILDYYAQHDDLLENVATAYRNFQKLKKEQQELLLLQGQLDKLALLQYQIRELEELNLKPNEVQNLEEEHRKQSHAEQWLMLCSQILGYLQTMDDISPDHSNRYSVAATQNLNLALTELTSLKNQFPKLAICHELINNALIQLEEAINELLAFKDTLQVDPEQLKSIDTRLSQIHATARKHKISSEQLLEHQASLVDEATKIKQVQESLGKIEQQLTAAETSYFQEALVLSKNRKKTALILSKLITESMHKLEMSHGQFEIYFQENDESRKKSNSPSKNDNANDIANDNANITSLNSPTMSMSIHGIDNLEFRVTTNPGHPPQALRKIASGGELSRISLAIQVITAQKMTTPSLIFDEVDVGVSGKTAEIVGQLLRQLADHTQVLCVTHLPQVAAKGHQHYKVEKQQLKNTTQTHILPLDTPGKIAEIARLLGGIQITKNTLAHAKEMLQSEALTETD